ncbi:YhzD family protein [Lentibacillus sp.]|uniref:YhzD family protein n=1 Tax=Lentibacillus sp. TaxID=1925746 RepID=UPI002B4B486D|nr:YhzD family protein [Lentibacillus sp.]HLS09769.1 YhzD family protein [Lentibacillus sp.]
MKTYFLTVFDKSGERLLNETFEASNNDEAKKIGQKRLDEEGYSEYTHRCVSPEAKLVLFHR